jgi:hypothetical protein
MIRTCFSVTVHPDHIEARYPGDVDERLENQAVTAMTIPRAQDANAVPLRFSMPPTIFDIF